MKHDIRIKFGKRLRYLRQKLDLTQEDLARRAHIHPRYLQNLEGSKPNAVTIVTQEKIARGLNVSIGELMDL